ncbi:MAG: type ISP restriction/modification enzyme [Microthrixaceae bacterium]
MGNATPVLSPLHLRRGDPPVTRRPALFSDAGTDSNDTDGGDSGQPRRHNVTDHALVLYRTLDSMIDKDDVFFYVYGILHSTDYRSAFAADLKKSLPRIPQVDNAEDFWAFSKAGRELAELHTNYENVEPWPDLTYEYAAGADKDDPATYRVTKMKHPKVKTRRRVRRGPNPDHLQRARHCRQYPRSGLRLRTRVTLGYRLGDGGMARPHGQGLGHRE